MPGSNDSTQEISLAIDRALDAAGLRHADSATAATVVENVEPSAIDDGDGD